MTLSLRKCKRIFTQQLSRPWQAIGDSVVQRPLKKVAKLQEIQLSWFVKFQQTVGF